jgi:prepilin-type processing-associated H-X9-DG protein
VLNYAANLGCGQATYAFNGAFTLGANPAINIADFSDGTSNTAAMAEWLLAPTGTLRDERRSVFNAAVPETGGVSKTDTVADFCHGLDASGARVTYGRGRDWLAAQTGYSFYNHALSVGDHSCTDNGNPTNGVYTAVSLHTDGANALFTDGHVSLISKSVSRAVWRAMGSRSGGDIIP